MSVAELGPGDDQRWQAFLAGQPGALVFHHPAWLRGVCAAHGYEPMVLAHHDAAGRLDGVLPLVRKHGWITGRRLVSLPHTPVAGPIAANREAAGSLAVEALKRARDANARLELKTRPGALDRACAELRGVPWSTTFVLRLPEDPVDIRFGNSRNHSRIKWSVGKAAKHGVALRDAESHADLKAWHALYLATMRKHAIPPRPYRFFAALWDHLRPPGLLRLMLAERDRELLAGSLFLMFGSTIFYAFNGRRPEALALGTNDLIQWHSIHEAAAAGFRCYDFGEVDDRRPGLAKFKAKWGAEPEPLFRYLYPPQVPSTVARRRLQRARRWGEAAWRRLPLAATDRIGNIVYQRL